MYMNVHKTGFSAVSHKSVMIFKLAHLIHLDLDHQNVFRQFHVLFYQNQINSSIRLSGIRLSGIRLSGIRLSGIRLSGIRLSGIRLSGIRLSGIRLSGIRLSGIRLSGIRLSGIRLSGIRYPSFLPCRSAAIVRRCNNKAQDICTMFTYSLQVAVASSILNIFRSKAVNILGKR